MQGTPLRGVVAAKYGSCSKFASAIGWSPRKTRDIVSGRRIPNAKDINTMAKCLDIDDPVSFMTIFFEAKSTM